MDEDFKVFHTVATNEKEFVPMRGSKYVQSDLRDIFPKVKEFLGKGKKVHFLQEHLVSCWIKSLSWR